MKEQSVMEEQKTEHYFKVSYFGKPITETEAALAIIDGLREIDPDNHTGIAPLQSPTGEVKDNTVEVGKSKPFIVANVRELLDQYGNNEITYSRMVELLNEIAFKYFSSPVENSNTRVIEYLKGKLANYSFPLETEDQINFWIKELEGKETKKV